MRESHETKTFDMWKLDFDNLYEFSEYISNNTENEPFGAELADHKGADKSDSFYPLASCRTSDYAKKFAGSNSYEEAIDLFKNGIPDKAEKLTNMLKAEEKMQPVQMMKRVNSIQGFQPVVPLYLMGVPNNMISMKMKPVKQKVVNLYTNVSYLASTTAEQIEQECIKKFRLISKLESQNYRVNLSLVFGTKVGYSGSNNINGVIVSIKLKKANERLNVSKLAFPLTHPSMERRLMFRFIETCPRIKSKRFLHGYGTNWGEDVTRACFSDGYVLPLFIRNNVDEIKSLDDIKYL